MKAIIFDLDNTLIDFMKMKRVSCEHAIDAMIKSGLKISKKKGMKIMFDIYSLTTVEDHEIFEKFLIKVDKMDYKKLAKAIIAYRKTRVKYLHAYPGTKKVLSVLSKNYKLAIVSDAPTLKAWMRLCYMGIEKYFDVVVGFDDTKRRKPSTLPFKKALKQLDLKASDCLMIGDSLQDIIGARRVGMKSAFAKYGSSLKNVDADIVLNDISELLKIDIGEL